MNVGSVSTTYGNSSSQAMQRIPESAEVTKAGGDNDGDADDGGAKAVQAAPAPTVNLSGQRIGQLINVTA
jgi:hypothetical protein